MNQYQLIYLQLIIEKFLKTQPAQSIEVEIEQTELQEAMFNRRSNILMERHTDAFRRVDTFRISLTDRPNQLSVTAKLVPLKADNSE